jgi:hypothetical protein
MSRQNVTNHIGASGPGPDGVFRGGTTTGVAATAGVPDVTVRLAGALLALAVSAVHVADQGGITVLNSPPWIGWSYRLIEVGGVLTALALLVPWRALLARSALWSRSFLRHWSGGLGWAAGVLLGIGPFVAYIASRSVGIPGDHHDVGNWGYWTGTVSLFVEAALVVLSITVLVAIWQGSRSASAAGHQAQLRLGMIRQPAVSTDSDPG